MTSLAKGNNVGAKVLNTIPKAGFTPILDSSAVTSAGNKISTSQIWTIGQSSYTYMRSKTIEFRAQGLKPNTEYYPFFDGVFVGRYCSQVAGAQASPLKSNAQGDIVGNFFLPANTFVSGTHTFELVDNVSTDPSGATISDPLFGGASATYEASGILKVQQTQVTDTVFDTSQKNIVNNITNINNTVNNIVNINNVSTTNNLTTVKSPPPVDNTPAKPVSQPPPKPTPTTLPPDQPAPIPKVPDPPPPDPTPPKKPEPPPVTPPKEVPAIQPPAPVICEQWRFSYAAGGGASVSDHTIITETTEKPTTAITTTGAVLGGGFAGGEPFPAPTTVDRQDFGDRVGSLVEYLGYTRLPDIKKTIEPTATFPSLLSLTAAIAAANNTTAAPAAPAGPTTQMVPQYEHKFRRANKPHAGSMTFVTWQGRSTDKRPNEVDYVYPSPAPGAPSSSTPAGIAVLAGLPFFANLIADGKTKWENDRKSLQIITPWTRLREITCPKPEDMGKTSTTGIGDPLAQSFFIETTTHPNGVFITSIDVYFKTVDQSCPVTLELRNMVNGLPGPNIYPNGVAFVPGYSTRQSNDSSLPTTFRFDQPIYLKPNTDYCFVVKSVSLGYNLWCSRLGEVDKLTGAVIDTQPYLGTLFKSENDVTWVPDGYEDIKFDLYVANFDISKTGDLVFNAQKSSVVPDPTETIGYLAYTGASHTLPLSYISTTVNSKQVTIKAPLHGLEQNDRVLITGIAEPDPQTGYNNILYSDLNGEFNVTSIIDSDTFVITTTGNNANKTGPLMVQDSAHPINVTAPTPASFLQHIALDKVSNPNTFSPSTAPAQINLPQPPATPIITSSTTFTVYTNVMVNEVMIDYLGTEFDQTEIIENINIAGGKSISGDEIPYSYKEFFEVQKDGTYYSFDEPRMIASVANETLHSTELLNKPSIQVNIKMKSQVNNISPIIDVQGMSLMVRTFKINNQNDEIDDLLDPNRLVIASIDDFNNPLINSEIVPGRGNAIAKYKSELVQLTKFYQKLSIFVVGNCPDPAVIDCYVRTSADDFTHMDRNWAWASIDGIFKKPFNPSPSKLTNNEWLFEYETPIAFNKFDIKLVMRSKNASMVPKIYGIRALTDQQVI